MHYRHDEEEAYEALKTALRALKRARKLCDKVEWDGDEVFFTLEDSQKNIQYVFDIIRTSTPWIPSYEARKANQA